jgi:hypothetical protein
MGTIGDFGPQSVRQRIIKKLLQHAMVVYLDFYPPTAEGFAIRRKMYEEEGWINVRLADSAIVSDDGLYSNSLSRSEFEAIAQAIGARIAFHHLCEFADIAEFRR